MRTYTEQTTYIWKLRAENKIGLHEQDLYMYLLTQSLQEHVLSFELSTSQVCKVLGIQRQSVGVRRAKLSAMGLIEVQLGRGRFCLPVYTLLGVKCDGPMVCKTAKQTLFVPPTADEVKAYCIARKSVIDAVRFYNYYRAKDWMVGNAKMKDWQQAVQSWEVTERKPQNRGVHNQVKHTNATAYEQF